MLSVGPPAVLEVSPNSSWPDLVYYNSFTHSNMGWKIHIIDSYTEAHSNSVTASLAMQIIALIMLYVHYR